MLYHVMSLLAKRYLGLYLSENEGAHFWLSVLNDLRARGLENILIASIKSWQANWEALSGLPH